VASAATEFFGCEAAELNVKAVDLKYVCEWELNEVRPLFKLLLLLLLLLLCVLFFAQFPRLELLLVSLLPLPR